MNNQKKSYLAALMGHLLVTYDVPLFGFLALSLKNKFFPQDFSSNSLLWMFATFSAGFVARPLGAIGFGYLGDRSGRKIALFWSLFLVSLASFGIGLLPTYEKIGLLSPLFLIILRLFQGISAGAEYGGALIYVKEKFKKEPEILSSILLAFGFLGLFLGVLACYVFNRPFFGEDGWRIPFILGGIFGAFSIYLRFYMEESEEFSEVSQNKKKVLPKRWMKENKRNILCVFGMGAVSIFPIYLSTVYLGVVYAKKGYLPSEINLINLIVFLMWGMWVIGVGYLHKFFSSQTLMALGSMVALSSGLYFLSKPESYVLDHLWLLQLTLIVSGGLFLCASGILKPKLFPVKNRYKSVAISYTLGQSLIAGTGTFTCALFVETFQTEKALFLPTILVFLIGALSSLYAKPYNSLRES